MTVRHQSIIPETLIDEFMTCTRLQYNGNLDITCAKGQSYSFYYRLGRIVWATGGTHPCRRWRRNMAKYCPQVNVSKMQLHPEDMNLPHWDYLLLEALHKEEKINRQQVNDFVDSAIAELLFDLAQQVYFGNVECHPFGIRENIERNQRFILDTPISWSSTDISMRNMRESWDVWYENNLANFSPNLAPVIRQPQQLQEMVSPTAYRNFVKLMNGKDTLRDLALTIKQDISSVGSSLLPYVLRGIIELIEVADLPLPTQKAKISPHPAQVKQSYQPLIACIDDSPQVCHLLENIVTSNGMRFLGINNPVMSLSTAIEHKPDLIFLDLMMPVINGYELCTQLRRISGFANTPIIILTGSNGLFDRVRAKVVGSTDFMTKPIMADKLMAMIQKHLQDVGSTKLVTAISELQVCCV
jgi:two-component system, chemotaxis family, response regulator PixG